MATPDTSKRIFDESKYYVGSSKQQLREAFDWDFNEDVDERLWWEFWNNRLTYGDSGGVAVLSGTTLYGFKLVQAAAPANNVDLVKAPAFCKGRIAWPGIGGIFGLDESGITPTNYILKGASTTITEVTPGATYTVEDTNKDFSRTNLGLAGSSISEPCRLRFTSGTESGNTFDITGVTATVLTISGNAAGAVATDTYVLLPPVLATPTTPQTDTLSLVTWLEGNNNIDDSNLEDSTLGPTIVPSVRYEMRWMIYPNWPGVEDSDITRDFFEVTLGTITRGTGISDVTTDTLDQSTFKAVINLEVAGENFDSIEAIKNNLGSMDYESVPNLAPQLKSDAATGNYTLTGYTFKNAFTDDATIPNVGTNVNDTTGTLAVATELVFATDPSSTDIATKDVTASALSTGELVLASLYRKDASIFRQNRMGEVQFQRGFSWVALANTVTISPGEAHRYGMMLQTRKTVSLDLTLGASYVGGVAPVSARWVYLYMARNSSVNREVIPVASFDAPDWSGNFTNFSNMVTYTGGSGEAFFIGAVYFDGANFKSMTCINNKVMFAEDVVFKTVTQATAGATLVPDVLPPVGADEFKFTARVSAGAATGADNVTATVYHLTGILQPSQTRVGTLAIGTTGYIRAGTHQYTAQANVGDSLLITCTGFDVSSSIVVTFEFVGYTFDPFNTIDRAVFTYA